MDCIDAWLVSNSSCPSCRKSLLDAQLNASNGVVELAAETSQSAQMHVIEGGKGVTATHGVQTEKNEDIF